MNIESDIPIPPPQRGDGRRAAERRSPFVALILSMDVGQSILLDSLAQQMYAAKILRGAGRSYASRKLRDGFRVWRTT